MKCHKTSILISWGLLEICSWLNQQTVRAWTCWRINVFTFRGFLVLGGQRFIRAARGDSLSLAILSVPDRIWLFWRFLFTSFSLSGSPTLSLFLSERRGRDKCEVTLENASLSFDCLRVIWRAEGRVTVQQWNDQTRLFGHTERSAVTNWFTRPGKQNHWSFFGSKRCLESFFVTLKYKYEHMSVSRPCKSCRHEENTVCRAVLGWFTWCSGL